MLLSFFFRFWCVLYVLFFFFSSRRRHTRLVSDWSSDVCSSDLLADKAGDIIKRIKALFFYALDDVASFIGKRFEEVNDRLAADRLQFLHQLRARSEERRVGKERRSRGEQDHAKKKQRHNYREVR